MQTNKTTVLLLIGTLGVLLTAGGAWAMRAELRPYMAERPGSTARVLELASGSNATGLSILSQQQYLFDCRAAMTSMAGRTQPTDIRKALIANCLAASDNISAKSPSFSVAWLTGAIASAEVEDWQGLNDRLLHSQLTGSNEQWIAESRVELAEDHFEHLAEAVLIGHEADLAMLVQSERGVRSIAQRYLDEPQFRERIASIVDTLPLENKKRFVNLVERFAKEAKKRL